MRAGLAAMGGVQGLLRGNPTAGADGTAAQTSGHQSAGEAGADAATTTRVTSAVQQGAGFFGPVGAGLASTALFTALHLPEQAGYYWGLLPIAALGGFASWLRLRSGSLWPGVVAHVCFNALVGFCALH